MKKSGNNRSNTHTDWESASSWFGERQNDRINTAGGRYSRENEKGLSGERAQRERTEPERRAPVKNRNSTKPANPSSSKKSTAKKAEIRGISSYRAKNRNSGKSNDELRREHAEKTRKKRKHRIIGWFILTALIFVAMFIVASLTVLFHIEEINVEGDTRYSREEIIECSGIEAGDNLWRTLTSDVYERLSYSLPYIGKVKIKRNIPSSITIVTEEAVPEYALRNGKRFIIVDANDKVLELKAKKSGKVPIVEGVDASLSEEGRKLVSDAYESYSTAKEIIEKAKENSIELSKIKVQDTNDISAVCEKKIRLDIGSASQLDEKLKMANEVISKLRSEGSLGEGIINLKSATKAFYRDGYIEETEPVKEKKKEKTSSDKKQTGENSTSENRAEVKEKNSSDIPAPPSQRPE